MWGLHKRKNIAVKNWRSRARLIDTRKTRLTIINTKTPNLPDFTEDIAATNDPKISQSNTEISNANVFPKNAMTPDEPPGTPVSFVLINDRKID